MIIITHGHVGFCFKVWEKIELLKCAEAKNSCAEMREISPTFLFSTFRLLLRNVIRQDEGIYCEQKTHCSFRYNILIVFIFLPSAMTSIMQKEDKTLHTMSETIVYKNIDDVLQQVGSYGRFQLLLNFALCITMIPISFPILLMYFAARDPPWRCVNNSSLCTFNRTMTSSEHQRCRLPRDQWEFTVETDYSIIAEFELYCDRYWITYLTTSAVFVGWAVGSVLFGWFADNYGRRMTLYPTFLGVILFNFISAFSPNVIFFTVARFLIGVFLSGALYQLFVCMAEFTTKKFRALSVNLIRCSFSVGLCVLAVKAYFIQRWRTLLIVCSAPYVVVLAFFFYVPESVRWLNIQGKSVEMKKIFQTVARFNTKTISSNFSIEQAQHSSNTSNPLDLFRPLTTCCRNLVQSYSWMVIAMVFYGLSLASNDLGGSLYTSFVLINLSEIPGTIGATYLSNSFGRKKTVCGSTFMAAIFCLCVSFVSTRGDFVILRVVLGMIGKIFVSSAFSSIIIWSLELQPTQTRSQAIGFFQLTSRIGSASAPWIAKALRYYHHGTPFVVMAVSMFVSAVVLLKLPETFCDDGREEQGNELMSQSSQINDDNQD